MSAATPAATEKNNGKKAAEPKTEKKKKSEPKPPSFDVSTVEYIVLTPVLDASAKGTVRRDRSGTRAAGAARTERLTNSRVYRTAADRFTIQTPQGEEMVFHISLFEKMLAHVKDLRVTQEIPNFS